MSKLDTSGFQLSESRIVDICEAYESGFGHGLKKDGLDNPYFTPVLKHAYDYGYERGLAKSKEVQPSKLPKGFRAVKDNYQIIFNAIGDAINLPTPGGSVGISVRRFWEAIDKAQPEVTTLDGQDVINVTQ